MTELFIMSAILIFIITVTLITWINNRIKIPADEAAIIYGKKSRFINPSTGEAKIVNSRVVSKGGATFKVPFIEDVMYVDLKIIQIRLQVEDLPSANFVKVEVDALAVVKVRDDDEAIRTAATRFGDFRKKENKEAFKKTLHEILQGHLRSTISTLTPEDLNSEREKFNQQVQEASGDRLAQLGIQIVDFTIQIVRDKEGYLEKLREDKVEKKYKTIEIEASNAKREKEEVIAKNQMKIIEYQTEQKILAENKRGELETATINANTVIEVANKEREIIIKLKEIKLKAEENKKEELKYQLEKNKLVIDASGKAESSKSKAESILNIAEAESSAIRLKGTAEAESKHALANAYENLDEKSKTLFILEKLPELIESTLKDDRMSKIVSEISKPIGNIDSVKIYDFGGNSDTGNPLQKFSELTPSILINIVSKLKELGFNKLIDKIGLDPENEDLNNGNKDNGE